MKLALAAVVALSCAVASDGHAKLHCPAPRTTQSGAKAGPCDAPRDPNVTPIALSPGLQTIHIEETLAHSGAPMRLALSTNGADSFEDCILLGHIPRDPAPGKGFFSISVNIPDIDCPLCTLQLIQVMTDKITPNPQCTYNPLDPVSREPGACFSNYHSCADIAITGTASVANGYTCQEPAAWPYIGEQKNVFKAGFEAPWVADAQNANIRTLQGAPAEFTTLNGYCMAADKVPGVAAVPPGPGTGPTVPSPGTPTTPATPTTPGTPTTPNGPPTPAVPGQPAPGQVADGEGGMSTAIIAAIGVGGGAILIAGVAFFATRNNGAPQVMQAQPYNPNQQYMQQGGDKYAGPPPPL